MAQGIWTPGGGFDRQPQGPVEVDWSNPIARGLVNAFNPSGGLKGFGGSLSGVPSSLSPTPVGLGYYASSAVTTLSVPGNVRDAIFAAGEATCVQILVGVSTVDQGAGTLGSNADGDHYPYGGLLYLAGFTNTRIINGIAPVVDIMRPHVLAIQGKSGSHRITQNGKVLGTSSIGFSLASTISLNLSRAGYAWHYRGGIVLHCLWNRYLSDAEIASISANPWQLFRDDTSDALIFDMGSTAGPTVLVANPGGLSLAGQANSFLRGLRLSADPGALSLSGQAATLVFGAVYPMAADAGALSLAGQAATLVVNRITPVLVANPGGLSLTGQQASTLATRLLVANPGALSLAGQQATTAASRKLVADPGSINLLGMAASLGNGLGVSNVYVKVSGAYVAASALRVKQGGVYSGGQAFVKLGGVYLPVMT